MSKSTVWLAFVVLIAVGSFVPASAQQTPEELAKQSSEAWLALIDAGDFANSYDEAAQYFKNAVKKDQWQRTMQANRAPLGKVLSRTLKSAAYSKTLPGAPDGDYVVIQYDASFEHKQTAVETVTPMLDGDGKWRVSGYYIR